MKALVVSVAPPLFTRDQMCEWLAANGLDVEEHYIGTLQVTCNATDWHCGPTVTVVQMLKDANGRRHLRRDKTGVIVRHHGVGEVATKEHVFRTYWGWK